MTLTTTCCVDVRRLPSGPTAEQRVALAACSVDRQHGRLPRLPVIGSNHYSAHRPRSASLCVVPPPFETRRGQERQERLAAALESVNLIFNEGLCRRVGRTGYAPICVAGRSMGGIDARGARGSGRRATGGTTVASRCVARTNRAGDPILLLDQGRTGWDWSLIRHALAGLKPRDGLTQAPGP